MTDAVRTEGANGGEPAALSLAGISRRFGAVVALSDAALRVRQGTVHAVLGENGAGKTTLMRIAFGLIKPGAGTVQVRGRTVRFSSPSDALAAGVGMVHQHFTLVPAMTVAENVAMGGRGLFSMDQWAARVREIGERTGLVLDPYARVSELSVSAQQRCEILKALSRDVSLLILDEPTAVLAPDEAQELLRWMKGFAASGHAVVLITHKLRDAMAIASDVTVLRHGRTVLSTATRDTSEGELASAMLGAVAEQSVTERNAGAGAESHQDATRIIETSQLNDAAIPHAHLTATAAHQVDHANAPLALHNVSVRDPRNVIRLNNVSLTVSAGEIVGIAAVEGAGQRELLRVLSGRLDATTGRVTLPEHIGWVPEDRHNDALMLDAPLVENIALRDAGTRGGRMPWNELRRDTTAIIAQNDVKAASAVVDARTLSGGNQQKLILGREMAGRPQALVVENPTRGLDFRSTAAVHDALQRAKGDGTAVVVYSSDLDEVLMLADRVMVMHDGRLSGVPRDRNAIGRAMLGTA